MREPLFSKDTVNTGRLIEMDAAKSILVLALPFIHIAIVCLPAGQLEYGIGFFLDSIIGGPFSMPMYIFSMGICLSYSRRTADAKRIAMKGVKIGIIGLALQLCRYLIPYTITYLVTGNDYYRTWGVLLFLSFDVLQFASLALLALAVFIYFKVPDWALLLFGLVCSIVGTLLNGIDFGSPLANSLMGLIMGTEDPELLIESRFPFLNWFLIPASGYVFGKLLVRCIDKDRFYRIVGNPAAAFSVIYMGIMIPNRLGQFAPGENAYYHATTNELLFEILLSITVLSTMNGIVKIFPESFQRIPRFVASHLTRFYFIHWILITVFIECIYGSIHGDFTMTTSQVLVVSTIVAACSLALAEFVYRIHVRIRKGRTA